MTIGYATLLGILQGLAEFLPISSSAHLIIVPWLLGWAEHDLAFDVALHVGTLAAVLLAFAHDWQRVLSATYTYIQDGRPFSSPDSKLFGIILLASLPAAVSGLVLEHWAERAFRSPPLIAINMVALGTLLLIADRSADRRRSVGPMTLGQALIIGCAQAVAVIPGVSRGGATITAALLLGHRREDAARFSFLLATPVIFGAAVLKVPEILASPLSHVALVGVAVSAVVGLLAIRFLLRYVRTKNYRPFVYYRWAFAAVIALTLWLRMRSS
jgi:undecaprenyl-diphosphatase